MSSDFQKIHEFVTRALAARLTASPNAVQVSAAFDQLCERMRQRLQPLFGAPATQALFARALDLANAEFPWLAKLVPPGSEQCAPDELNLLASRVTAEQLQHALAVVLSHDIALLSELVGSDLIIPLIEEAWGVAAASPDRDEE